MYKLLFFSTLTILFASCNKPQSKYDASGTFETTEIIVSAEQTGKILSLNINEGMSLTELQTIGKIDVSNLELQKNQRMESIKALSEKTTDVNPQLELVRKQLAVQNAQLAQQQKEQNRISNLVKAEAATQKQLDDINAAIDQLQKQIEVTKQQINLYQTNAATQNRSILSETDPMQKSVAVIDDQIKKGVIINPVKGTVLTQYAFSGEFAALGKPLYKIADLSSMILRAYITGNQLPNIKLNQTVKVLIATDGTNYKEYDGVIEWISDRAEFTPKTIQTKDERANLVYAIKVKVKNDGYLKIGMYADIKF